MGLSKSQLTHARSTLRKRGIEVPLFRTYGNFETSVRETDDHKKLQEILNGYTDGSLRGYISNHRKDEEKTLITLSSVLREGYFTFQPQFLKLFVERLQIKGIPMRGITTGIKESNTRTARYWIVFYKNREEIIDVLKEDPDLQRFKENPVRLAFGAFEGKMPNTTELKYKRGYESVRMLVDETLEIKTTGRAKTTSGALLHGCTASIFRYNKGLYFSLSQKAELQAFIRKRYEELQSARPPPPKS